MPARKGLLAPQNTFLDTIATRFDGTHSNFVLGNAKITRIYPIVYCSDGFCELTGYSRAHIMQKSCACNFLYGQKTDVQHRDAISKSLEQKLELKLEVILYKSSGTPFWCLLDIVPIHDEKQEVVLFLCSHKDITKQKLYEQQQRVALHHQMHLQADQQEKAENQPNQLQHAVEMGEASDKQQQQHQLTGEGRAGGETPASSASQQDGTLAGQPLSQQQQQQLTARQQQEHDDQQALISMEEFCIDDVGDGEDELDGDQDDADHDKHTANQYSRRRSRAVLYQLSGHYGYRRSVNMKSKLKLNNRMTIPEYKTTTIEKQKFILSHYGLGKSCWDWLILIVSFYVAIVVPYNATFKEKRSRSSYLDDEEEAHLFGDATNQSTSTSFHRHSSSMGDAMGRQRDEQVCEIDSIDIFVEVVFIIDVLLNFRTTFVNRKGEVVTRPKIICRHYFRGWFIVDACAALPFDLLCGLNLLSRSLSNIDLNLLKLIRLLRLARLLQKMDRYSQYSYIILTLLMLIFSLLAHWCACIWYVIAMEEIGRHPPEWKLGWIHQLSDKLGYNVVNATDMASSYVTALYFTTSSLTSVGFGNVSANTNAEKIFSIVIMLIGALMHAVVFGNVTALIRVMYARRSNYQTRLRDLKDFFRLHQLPKDLQQRMSDYFQTTWSLNHGIETYEILKDFPEELRGDVSLHLHREVLSLPIFASAPQGFLKSLARHIESKFCCPTEYLIHRGDALSYLYLVCNGSMEVLQDNMVVGILGKGDLVGYDVNAMLSSDQQASSQYGASTMGGTGGALTSGGVAGSGNQMNKLGQQMSGLVKSSSDLKALTYCDLKCIHIGGLLEVLKLYPEFADTFHDEIIHDLSFNLREQHEEHDDEDDEEEEEEEDDEEDDDLTHHNDTGHDDDDNDDDDVDDDDDDDDNDNDGRGGGRNGNREGQENAHTDSGGRQSGENDRNGEVVGPVSAPSTIQTTQASLLSSSPNCNLASNQMGRLLRSITENSHDRLGGNEVERIGRYDFDDEYELDAVGDEDERETGQDEADEDDELDDMAQQHLDRSAERNGRNGDGSSEDGDASQMETSQARVRNRRGVDCGRGGLGESGGQKSGCQQRQTTNRPPTARSATKAANTANDLQTRAGSVDEGVAEGDHYEAASLLNEALTTSERRSNVRVGGDGEMCATIPRFGGTKLAKQSCDTAEDNADWNHFSASYEGLAGPSQVMSPGLPGTQQAFAGSGSRSSRKSSGGLSETKVKNRSDETVLELAQLKRTASAVVGVANGNSPGRLKSAIGAQGQSRASKPPISFDLSRNTTAIIDRRRRSAGCIQRYNLISNGANQGAGGVRLVAARQPSDQATRAIGEGKRCQSSSLININENEPMASRQLSKQDQRRAPNDKTGHNGNNKTTRRTSIERIPVQRQQMTQNATLTDVPGQGAFKPSYSNHDLQQIDAHITASVRKLRQEFKQELNRAIESLARLMLEHEPPAELVARNPNTWQPAPTISGKRSKQHKLVPTHSSNEPAGSSGPPVNRLRRRDTASELSRCALEERGVNRSISSHSFNALSMNNSQREEIGQLASFEMQSRGKPVSQNVILGNRQQLVTRTSQVSSTEIDFQQTEVCHPSSIELIASSKLYHDDAHSSASFQQHQKHQPYVCDASNSERPVSQSSAFSSDPLRPSPDSKQQRGALTGQSAPVGLNASDNDSGRSTCSVNSSGVITASRVLVGSSRGISSGQDARRPVDLVAKLQRDALRIDMCEQRLTSKIHDL